MRGCVVDTMNPQIFRESVADGESCSELILCKGFMDNYEGTIIVHCSYPIQHFSTTVPIVNAN